MPDIRRGRDEDGAALAALIADVFTEYDGCPFIPADFPELAAPARHYETRGGALWVLESGGVRGSIALSLSGDRRTAELHKFYLARELRGSGAGRRLYDAALAFAETAGAQAIRLFTDTRFLSGHRFYERRGFRRLPGLRALGDETNAWEYAYRLSLGAS